MLIEPKKRECLNCHKMFLSQGKGNRICNPCKKKTANGTGQSVAVTLTGRRINKPVSK